MVDRNALARATESTTSPTPGYLFNDIAKSAATSPSSASEIATYLIRRLESKNNVNIKYKCLKVIQMVASHPATRGQFKRVIVQDTSAISAIKLCLQFRGPPDAVHGDMLYEKVRNQAKETLDAVYSDDPSSEQGMGGQGGIGSSGFGSQSYGGAGAGGSSGYGNNYNSGYGNSSSSMSSGSAMGGGPKKMEGIGNPMFADPRLNQKKDIGEMTMSDVISGVKEGFVGMIKDPLARNISSASSGPPRPGGIGGIGNSSYGGSSSGGWKSAPPGQSQLAQSTNGAWTMASNRGPNAISSESYRAGAGNVSSGVGGSWGSSTTSVASQSRHVAHNPNPIVNITGSTGGAKSDGTYERNLITELCPPGGMKAEPPPDKLQSFAQAIPNLNPDLICPALLDALEDGQPWIIRAKALCVMEVCINVAEERVNTGSSGNNAYADFFHTCKDEIEPLSTHSRSAVRDPAKRVLKALGLDVPERASATTNAGLSTRVAAAPAATAQAVEPNLLDFDEPVAPAPADIPPLPPSEAPPVPPAPLITGNSQSLFGGMQMKSETKPQVAPAPTPAPVADETDLLGNMSESPASAPGPSSSTMGSLFDDVAIKSSIPLSSSAPVVEKENLENAATMTPSSGFSFISGEGETQKTQSNTAPAKDTFDPLFGLSTPEAESSVQPQTQTGLNPQMAAVVQQQQQQIMMMQAQMQQMQMANSNNRYMMMQQQQISTTGNGNASFGTNPMMIGQMKQNVMGAHNGSGVATSFAFMEDPNKVKKDATNKKFDFVQDAMKGAR